MTVRNAILGLLAQQPSHGYELWASFEALIGGGDIWHVKPAQIYTTLVRLEDAGLVRQDGVEQDGGPEKRIYSLTPSGRRELAEWFGAGVPPEHQRDEFFVKLMISLYSEQADPYQVIRAQRNRLYQDLHALTNRRNDVDSSRGLAHIFLLDKSIMHLEADLRWLDLLEARLDDIRRQPLPQSHSRPRGRPKKSGN